MCAPYVYGTCVHRMKQNGGDSAEPKNQGRMVYAAAVVTADSDAADVVGAYSPPPAPPHRPYRQLRIRKFEEPKQQPSTGGGGDEEAAEEGKSTAVVQDSRSCSSSCQMYHRLITRPLDEIKLPSAQVSECRRRCIRTSGGQWCFCLLSIWYPWWQVCLHQQTLHIDCWR